MPRPLLSFAILPAVLFLLIQFLPASVKEPYAWLDPISLNTPNQDGRVRRWFNMGYWDGTDSFSDAAEQLASRLNEFADAPSGGRVLDIAHGSGESLLLHLSSNPPPSHLTAIASLSADTARSRALISAHKADQSISTPVEFFTGSAVPRLGQVGDQDHPLNPMRGFLGKAAAGGKLSQQEEEEQADEDNDDEIGSGFEAAASVPGQAGSKGYDLIYVLDAIYHFPPSLPSFLSTTLKSLSPGGVIAYTDLLPPLDLSPILARLLSTFIGVPLPNLTQRPKSIKEYRAEVESLGYKGVEVKEWSDHVWLGFATDLKKRGGAWSVVGRIVERADKAGWKFIAVRAEKPISAVQGM